MDKPLSYYSRKRRVRKGQTTLTSGVAFPNRYDAYERAELRRVWDELREKLQQSTNLMHGMRIMDEIRLIEASKNWVK